jgi:hypothetical protein
MKSGVQHVENWLACAPHEEMPPNREAEFLDALVVTTPTLGKSCVGEAGISFSRDFGAPSSSSAMARSSSSVKSWFQLGTTC